ncbi:MAG TPA: Fe-S cluster assembly ATPase SufC [Geobacterales bacterium]|nr:Fe-S cluster assembly ATPase SufC [Geobacterales bacterium]
MVDVLTIEHLYVEVEGKEILKDINLEVKSNEIHAIMGPNGAGKSSLAQAIMGHPRYKITKGDVKINGESILGLSTDKRAQKGLFISLQYPIGLQGITLFTLVRASLTALKYKPTDPSQKPNLPLPQIRKDLEFYLKKLGLDDSFINRYVNEGFSGGEKKKSEIVQMAMIKPKFAILDETDSGLDIDGIKIVASAIMDISRRETGLILITHYNRLLQFIRPDYVHILMDGRIVETGPAELADLLEQKGYDWFKKGL